MTNFDSLINAYFKSEVGASVETVVTEQFVSQDEQTYMVQVRNKEGLGELNDTQVSVSELLGFIWGRI